MFYFTIGGNHYAWSQRAFATRCASLIGSRNITTVAGGQATMSGLAFTGAGWTNMKRVIAELILGSIAFPADLNPDGMSLAPGVTEDLIGTRDVSSAVT